MQRSLGGEMRRLSKCALIAIVLLLVSLVGSTFRSVWGQTETIHPAFQQLWDRTDSLVASGVVSRPWFWGPTPIVSLLERFADPIHGAGSRMVVYFDKGRMEINDPSANPNSPFFVTSGLLVEELISGNMQVGSHEFVDGNPANIPIFGDRRDTRAPTYASFASVASTRLIPRRQPDRTGQLVAETIDKAGRIGYDATRTNMPGVQMVYYEPSTGHNVPEVFWRFLHATGTILTEVGQIETVSLSDPWFIYSGLPISDAYWSKIRVGTEVKDIMVQAFERRILDYIPTNPPDFQVEMGNVGLHYYDWRYRGIGMPDSGGAPFPRIPEPVVLPGVGGMPITGSDFRGLLGIPNSYRADPKLRANCAS